MARWRLTAKHYIHAKRFNEETQWVREETNRDTGRSSRKTYKVPMYLDPENGQDQNYPGEIIVAYEGTKFPHDIILEGPPTPDMEPLDAEAEEISAKYKPGWIDPIESLPANGGNYSEALLEVLSKQLDAASRQNATKPTVDLAAFEKMQADIKSLMEQNAKLQAMVPKPSPTAKV